MKETIAKINKTKSWFFEKINKIDKPLARLIKKNREKTQINRIRNEKVEVTTDTAEIQSVVRDYYKQVYGNKMDNLEKMDKFLEKHNLPRLNQEETANINRPITSTEIETVIKDLPTNNSPGTDSCTGEFYQHLETYPSQSLPKYSTGRNTPKFILQGHHHANTKPRQRCHKERKLKVNITDEHRCKNPQQNTSKQNPTAH